VNWSEAGKITVWAIIVGYPAWKLYRWGTQPVSASALRVASNVDAEQERTRAVVAHAPQWPAGVTTQVPDDHDYTYDILDDQTPESVMHFIQQKHQARLQQ
jgi:hypothetical protein